MLELHDILRIKNVTKSYVPNEAPAVSDLNLTLARKEVLALMGESGCGKSTTLRLIMGFEVPEKGTIWYDGRIVDDRTTWVAPEKRGIGMMFQEYALFPHLTVEKNIAFGLRSKSKKRVDEMLELVRMSGYGKRYPHELSGGQMQRVALARALAPSPKLILLDEPFNSLDQETSSSLLQETSRIIRESGTAAILVTHDVEEAEGMADRILVMENGKIRPPEIARVFSV